MTDDDVRLKAVILDLDGTLIDSNDAHARAFVEAGRELGFTDVSFHEVRWLIGMGGDKLIPKVFGVDSESDSGKRISERKGEIFKERFLGELAPTPGARALLERLREDGLRLIIATSASDDDKGKLLARAGVEDLVDETTSASDVEESKPAPDLVEAALDLAGAPSERVVMVGDTPYDIEAAARAGVPVIAVRCGGWADEDLSGALAIYDDPAHLLREYDSSPFRM
jgi:HAD superfamily hydrolase (TIGR01509 family)